MCFHDHRSVAHAGQREKQNQTKKFTGVRRTLKWKP